MRCCRVFYVLHRLPEVQCSHAPRRDKAYPARGVVAHRWERVASTNSIANFARVRPAAWAQVILELWWANHAAPVLA